MPKEDWNNVYFAVMAVTSVAVGTLGVAIGLLALQRAQAQTTGLGGLEPTGYTPLDVNIPKVHYENGDVLVETRAPGEWHKLREFVQPGNPYLNQAIREALHG